MSAVSFTQLETHSVAADAQTDVGSRLHFFGLCFYLAAQAMMIPLFAVGPSWTLWPSLADVGVGILCLACVWRFPSLRAVPPAHRRTLVWLTVVSVYCVSSFTVFTLLLPNVHALQPTPKAALLWGGYEVLRLGQFLIVFFVVSTIPLSPRRMRVLLGIVTLALTVACLSVLLTYTSVVPHTLLVAHLPSDESVCGPWIKYYHAPDGLGTLSYNHGDAACQILMLFILRLHLSRDKYGPLNAGFLIVSLAAIFATGSRTNLLAMLILFCVYVWQTLRARQFQWLGVACVPVLLAGLVFSISDTHLSRRVMKDHGELVERNVVSLLANRTKGFAGRTAIWEKRIRFLNEEPIRWVFGSGFGSAAASGSQSHNLFLNIVLETGLIGLIMAAGLMGHLLRSLWKLESRDHVILWGTLVLLVTCLTRETFYPVPHTAHFLGFFLAAVAIAYRTWAPESQNPGRTAAETQSAI